MNTEIFDIKSEKKTNSVTTTLFDLISAMQDDITQPTDETLIVPTVTQWLRSGKITFQSDSRVQPAA